MAWTLALRRDETLPAVLTRSCPSDRIHWSFVDERHAEAVDGAQDLITVLRPLDPHRKPGHECPGPADADPGVTLAQGGRHIVAHDRELFQVVGPDPPVTGFGLQPQPHGLDAADTIDTALVTGGFPEVTAQWQPGMTLRDFLSDQLNDPLSPLLIAGQLTMLGEFPEATQARAVLEAIGAGERTFGTIAQAAAGGSSALPSGALTPALGQLISRDVVAADLPLSTANSDRDKRYRIADPYLRFWLAFLSRAGAEAERGTGDRSVQRVLGSFPSWRGRAVEPLIRSSLARLLPNDRWSDANEVGGWWNRQNNPEIDLVAVDRTPATRSVAFAGSIKWLEQQPFDQRDLAALVAGANQIPGAENASLVAVTRAGTAPDLGLDHTWTPTDLVDAWR
jgi:hypothetical protein